MDHNNLQKLVIEIYKIVNGLCPEIMNAVFQFQIQNHQKQFYLQNSTT